MAIVITEEASVKDIDEAISHIKKMLAESGMDKSRRNILLGSLDDLLDARLEITQEEQMALEFNQEATNGNTGSSVNNAKALPE
jgi:predicted AAA+ superfamily ATPase